MAHAGELGADAIRFERVYDASFEDIWALWTTKEGIEEWFAPEGMRVEVSALRAAGRWCVRSRDNRGGAEQVAYLANVNRPLYGAGRRSLRRDCAPPAAADSFRHRLRARGRAVSLRHGGRASRGRRPSSDDPDGGSSPGPRDDTRRNPRAHQPAATFRLGHRRASNKGATTVMRPLLYSINVTLDGCVDHNAIPADEALAAQHLQAVHRHATESIGRADTLLFGRVTYQMMEGAWRLATRTTTMPEWTGTLRADHRRDEEVRGVEHVRPGRLERGAGAWRSGRGRPGAQARAGQGAVHWWRQAPDGARGAGSDRRVRIRGPAHYRGVWSDLVRRPLEVHRLKTRRPD